MILLLYTAGKAMKSDSSQSGDLDVTDVHIMKPLDGSQNEGIHSTKQLLSEQGQPAHNNVERDFPPCDLLRVVKTVAAYVAFFGGVRPEIFHYVLMICRGKTRDITLCADDLQRSRILENSNGEEMH